MITKKLAYDVADRVNIMEFNRKGRIVSVLIQEDGIKYEVRYFDNAKVQRVYFYEDEIEKGGK